MRNNLIHDCGNLFRLVKEHLTNPSLSMSAERLEENFGHRNAITCFVAPIAVTLATVSLVASLVWSDEIDLAASVYGMLTTAIFPFILFYLIKVTSCKVFTLFGITEDTEAKAQIVTLQLMLLYFTITFICTIFPGAKLFACLYIYAFYMLWNMAGEYLRLPDEQRVKFMMSEMLVIVIIYFVILYGLGFITPRHP